MSAGLITLLMFGSITVALATGLPIVFVLGGVAILFTYFLWGVQGLLAVSYNAFGVMDNFILIALPLFIYMGIILQHSGIAENLYNMMYKWIGGLRGGLAIGTVIICTVFAAMAGISAAATVSMGVIALPSMIKYKYNARMAIGSICAGGALGILIPPSVLMIVYGVFAVQSIGALFAGGVLPGLILSLMFSFYIGIKSWLRPSMGPSVPEEEKATWGERLFSLRSVILPILLIIIVLGTIFAGVATPSEAAAMGALGALFCALVTRRLTWQLFKNANYQTLRISCMIIWIIIAGQCLTSIYTASGAVEFIKGVLELLPVSRYIILIGMQLTIFVLGMLLDPGGIIMITTPVFVPVIQGLGFDPVWFGVLFMVNLEMAYLTPPFGLNLFYVKSIVPDSMSMAEIYKSVTPFVALQAMCLVLLIVFPEIVLWLPSILIK